MNILPSIAEKYVFEMDSMGLMKGGYFINDFIQEENKKQMKIEGGSLNGFSRFENLVVPIGLIRMNHEEFLGGEKRKEIISEEVISNDHFDKLLNFLSPKGEHEKKHGKHGKKTKKTIKFSMNKTKRR